MVRRILIALACCGFLFCSGEETNLADGTQSGRDVPVWTADPSVPGPDEPPVGRSLFDSLLGKAIDGEVVYDIPFPFEKLTARIESSFHEAAEKPVLRKVLIPIGRSLQRFANKPDYFGSPRVVVAADTEPRVSTGELQLRVKDRLFLGYQAQSALIEVISYNEEAGRFEFQIVSDYAEGRQPQVAQAPREVCIACHQGHAPIFPRPLWDETNANKGVRSRLAEHGTEFFGVKIDQGVDVPQLIDDATDRANRFSAYQLIWRQGCDESPQCRADALVAALQYRLSGFQHAQGPQAAAKDRFSQALSASWERQWPQGLWIPNPDIPNRDPLETARRTSQRARNSEVFRTAGTAEFAELVDESYDDDALEPRTPREPLEVWSVEDAGPQFYDQLIAGFGSFFTRDDIRAIDGRLISAGSCEPREFEAPCTAAVTREADGAVLRFECAGERLELAAWGLLAPSSSSGKLKDGEITGLRVAGHAPLTYLQIAAAKRESLNRKSGNNDECYVVAPMERSAGLHARLADGQRVSEVKLCWRADEFTSAGQFSATAGVAVCDDFALIRQAVASMALEESDSLSNKPLRPTGLMAELAGRF